MSLLLLLLVTVVLGLAFVSSKKCVVFSDLFRVYNEKYWFDSIIIQIDKWIVTGKLKSLSILLPLRRCTHCCCFFFVWLRSFRSPPEKNTHARWTKRKKQPKFTKTQPKTLTRFLFELILNHEKRWWTIEIWSQLYLIAFFFTFHVLIWRTL